MDHAFPPSEAEGKRGQATKAYRALVEHFGDAAPERNAISRWKAGIFAPSVDNAYMLAVALGVRPAWLAFNDGEMTTGEKVRHEPERVPPGRRGRRRSA